MARNCLICADVVLRNYSLIHSHSAVYLISVESSVQYVTFLNSDISASPKASNHCVSAQWPTDRLETRDNGARDRTETTRDDLTQVWWVKRPVADPRDRWPNNSTPLVLLLYVTHRRAIKQ